MAGYIFLTFLAGGYEPILILALGVALGLGTRLNSVLWTMHRRIVRICRFNSPTFTSRSCARLPTHLQIVATERHFEQSVFFHKNYTANPLLFARPVIIGCHTMATTSPPEHKERRRNRLANEKSPYLLQHASNPVDW